MDIDCKSRPRRLKCQSQPFFVILVCFAFFAADRRASPACDHRLPVSFLLLSQAESVRRGGQKWLAELEPERATSCFGASACLFFGVIIIVVLFFFFFFIGFVVLG